MSGPIDYFSVAPGFPGANVPVAKVQRSVVCVLDGDPAVRDSLQYLCDSAGQHALGFSTRAAFLHMLDAATDLYAKSVICEAQLPDASGLDVFKDLQLRGLSIPFALMVSRNINSALHMATRLGIDYVWSKPLVDRSRLSAFLDSS
jgi:FixJ family two-component response regulator